MITDITTTVIPIGILACNNPAILHFWGNNVKPWVNPDVKYGKEYWKSLEKTKFYTKAAKLAPAKNAVKVSYKLFNFLPLLEICRADMEKCYSILGIPVFKIKKHINGITTKYFVIGLPVLKVSRK